MVKESGNTFRTIAELADAAGVSVKTVYQWVGRGVVEHANYVGSTAVFTQAEFEEAKRVGLERKAAMNVLSRRG